MGAMLAQSFEQKKDPGKPGSQSGRIACGFNTALAGVFRGGAFRSSETEVGEVTVADSKVGARHQQTIDGGHKPAKKRGGGGREAERHCFGHCCPLVEAVQRIAAFCCSDSLCIPDASNNSFVCIAAYILLQCSIIETIGFPNDEKGRRKPAALGIFRSVVAYSAATFRGGSSAPESWISAT